jgi:hypothetical protein
MTTNNPSSAALWSSRVLAALVTLVMIADGAVDLFRPSLVQAEMAATGFPEGKVHLVGAIILVCRRLYAIPRTSVLGAILMTGFLGGAICTHFRVGEIATAPQLVSLLLGGSAWGALYLRDLRVRTLLPLVDLCASDFVA